MRSCSMRMIVLLPAHGQFEAFEQALMSERVTAILQSLKQTDLQLLMPKFKYETSLSLAKTLAQMGMTDALTPGTADFSGMDDTRNLYVSQVAHKAFVAVDESGLRYLRACETRARSFPMRSPDSARSSASRLGVGLGSRKPFKITASAAINSSPMSANSSAISIGIVVTPLQSA